MSDPGNELDILAWSESRARQLRKLAGLEGADAVDLDGLADRVAELGRSELRAVQASVRALLMQLLKLTVWPDDPSAGAWRDDAAGYQRNARRRMTPSMEAQFDVQASYAEALGQARAEQGAGEPILCWPEQSPFTLEQLLREDVDVLLPRMIPAY